MLRKYEKCILHWLGKAAAGVSFLLIGLVVYCYTFRHDWSAAVSFFPAWAWGVGGMVLGSFALIYKRHISLTIVICWLVFILIFAEEPKSLLRGCFVSSDSLQKISEEKLVTVISLNCGGGNIKAVNEISKHKPDIVLLQEMPLDLEELKSCAQKIFNGHATITFDLDNAIIAGGEVEKVSLVRPHKTFMTQARVRFKSGFEVEVISTRLQPPTIDINLLSADCWKAHRKDRKQRREQISMIVGQIKLVADEVPVIVGGDFNVGANNGSFKEFGPYLRDTFRQGGVGWGHTALNTVPLFRVDQIWASSEFRPISVFAEQTQYSDHRMVICHMAIR